MSEGSRANIYYVYRVLENYSDSEHFLSQKDICDLISKGFHVEVEKKTIGRTIEVLINLDFDIQKKPRRGFALVGRRFDESEIKFLVDAVFSSKAIPGKMAQKLASRLSESLSVHERKNYSYLLKSGDVNRTENKQVFYNIEIINEAIRRGKWIAYQYMTYDKTGKEIPRFEGYIYHASPCYLISNNGNYYLLAFRRGKNKVLTWRVDYMREISIMEDRERLDPKTLEEFSAYKDITEYMNDHIYLFGGEVVDAVLKLKGEYAISYVKDWFGSSAKLFLDGDTICAKVRCDENALFYWAMQYGNHITLISPEKVVNRILEAAQDMMNKYQTN